jgi:hypothetical protein
LYFVPVYGPLRDKKVDYFVVFHCLTALYYLNEAKKNYGFFAEMHGTKHLGYKYNKQ